MASKPVLSRCPRAGKPFEPATPDEWPPQPLEFNLVIRTYAGNIIRPMTERFVGKDGFIPETMSTSCGGKR